MRQHEERPLAEIDAPLERIDVRLQRIETAIDRTKLPPELVEHLINVGVAYSRSNVDAHGRYAFEIAPGSELGKIQLMIIDYATHSKVWALELGR